VLLPMPHWISHIPRHMGCVGIGPHGRCWEISDMAFNWTCPYCGYPQTVTDQSYSVMDQILGTSGSKFGDVGLRVASISCANEACRELAINASLHAVTYERVITPNPIARFSEEQIASWRLRPKSESKPQPDYILEPLRQDYYEACTIRDLSPKASATLARRCLQGMIRDFCGISKNRLIDEIKELRRLVDAGQAPRGVQDDTVDAIDHVRELEISVRTWKKTLT
jgi:hypothetical protein